LPGLRALAAFGHFVGQALGAGWMRFAGRKLSEESLMFGSPPVGKSLTRIDESSFD
jgi:hypothetical protein